MSTVHAKCRVVVPMLLLPLLTFAQTPSLPSQPLAVDGATAYVYKSIGGDQLRLHVFSPDSPTIARKPAVVFFFGGGWTTGSVTQFVPQATHLSQRGMVAIVADYRVFNRHGTSAFDAMADAKSAVRWVRAHSAQLGVDPNRIAAAGGSSGCALACRLYSSFMGKPTRPCRTRTWIGFARKRGCAGISVSSLDMTAPPTASSILRTPKGNGTGRPYWKLIGS